MSTQEEPSIRLCKGECGRMTRPRNGRKPRTGDVVTIMRIDSKYCSPCYSKLSPVAIASRQRAAEERAAKREARTDDAFKAYDAFLAGRQARMERAQRVQSAMTAVRMRQSQARLIRT